MAGSAGCRGGELELELPMMSVVQTRILPTEDDCDPDVLQAITSLGCFKDRKKLIQELLNPKSVAHDVFEWQSIWLSQFWPFVG